MANFHDVEIRPLDAPVPCYWCELDGSRAGATQLIVRTSNLTNRRYSDAACDRHARPWRMEAWRESGRRVAIPITAPGAGRPVYGHARQHRAQRALR